MSANINPEQLEMLLQKISEKTNLKTEDLKSSAQSGSFENIINKLSPGQAEKLQAFLSDKSAADKLLSSPQARALIKKFLEK